MIPDQSQHPPQNLPHVHVRAVPAALLVEQFDHVPRERLLLLRRQSAAARRGERIAAAVVAAGRCAVVVLVRGEAKDGLRRRSAVALPQGREQPDEVDRLALVQLSDHPGVDQGDVSLVAAALSSLRFGFCDGGGGILIFLLVLLLLLVVVVVRLFDGQHQIPGVQVGVHQVIEEEHLEVDGHPRPDDESGHGDGHGAVPGVGLDEGLPLFSATAPVPALHFLDRRVLRRNSVVIVHDFRAHLARLERLHNDRGAGEDRLREAHILPIPKVVVQHLQVMRLHVQVRLRRHGVTELLHRAPETEPPHHGDAIDNVGRDGHEPKVHIDESRHARMSHLDRHERPPLFVVVVVIVIVIVAVVDISATVSLSVDSQDGAMDLGNAPRRHRLHLERGEDLPERSGGYAEGLLHRLLGEGPRMGGRVRVELGEGLAQGVGEHVGASGGPLAFFHMREGKWQQLQFCALQASSD
mmetsp:Transcript_38380/g.114963  ORF Transcript_38380/g.114963 Transcript_38380/m.114963 type:complete len:467 (+) Transcript_38380:864-2264(+)